MAPWTALDWVDVHAGHLPLWNPYSALGMPLAFNFQSAPFALPTLVGYLAPLHYAYTTAVLFKLILAGTGALFLCRKLGLSNLSAVFRGDDLRAERFLHGWFGWPQATVISLLGWVLGATIAILERDGNSPGRDLRPCWRWLGVHALRRSSGERALRRRMHGLVVVVFLLARVHQMRGQVGRALSPLIDLGVAGVAGVALAAPLLLPGIPILSARPANSDAGYVGLPRTYLINLVAPGYFGFPTAGSATYGSVSYYEAASYVGSITVILALFSVLCLWRRPIATLAFAVMGAIMLATLFVPSIRARGRPAPRPEGGGMVARGHAVGPRSRRSRRNGTRDSEKRGVLTRICAGCRCQRVSLPW